MRQYINLVETNLTEMQRQKSEANLNSFISMVRDKFPSVEKQRVLSARDLQSVAIDNNVKLPSILLTQKKRWANKLIPSLWDLSVQNENDGDVLQNDVNMNATLANLIRKHINAIHEICNQIV